MHVHTYVYTSGDNIIGQECSIFFFQMKRVTITRGRTRRGRPAPRLFRHDCYLIREKKKTQNACVRRAAECQWKGYYDTYSWRDKVECSGCVAITDF